MERDGWPTQVYLHRFIVGLKTPKPLIDHQNRDGLDNRRGNLRTCTNRQNCANREGDRGSSKYKGVYRSNGRWVARITVNRRTHHIASSTNEREAALFYNIAARLFFGEFAYLNAL